MQRERSVDRVPLTAKVAGELKKMISSGKLPVGSKLPGRSALLAKFGVSKSTLSAALAQLEDEGLIASHPKSCFVVVKAGCSAPDWAGYIKRAHHMPSNPDFRRWADEESGLTEFGLSSDFDMTPFIKDALEIAVKKLSTLDNEDFGKYGYEPLREKISEHLKTIDVHCPPREVLIVPGGVQSNYILYESLMNYASSFIYEKANLINIISNIHSLGMRMVPVSLDEHGISAKEAEKEMIKHRYPVLHLDPTDHAPTGTVMSLKRKREIIKLANKYRCPVLEIEHLREAWVDKPFPPPLKSIDSCKRVIYSSSFIRAYPFDFSLSWFAADPYLLEHLSNVQLHYGLRVNALVQVAAYYMFESGAYTDMYAAFRKQIKRRRETALELCRKYLSGLGIWKEKNCNFHFWIEFPGINMKKIFAKTHRYLYYPGYFVDRSDISHILLCPCSIREEDMETAVKEIATVTEKELRRVRALNKRTEEGFTPF